VVPFEQRAAVLHALILADQREQGQAEQGLLFGGGSRLRIRRNEILGDAYAALGNAGPDRIKQKMRVVFVSEDGHEEAGIDGGGLFKEFLESFVKAACNPGPAPVPASGSGSAAGHYQYFTATESHELIPTATTTSTSTTTAAAAAAAERLEVYKFIGAMLAKAVYSEILLEPQVGCCYYYYYYYSTTTTNNNSNTTTTTTTITIPTRPHQISLPTLLTLP
jgi:ubiquitin-protein ligase E3 C